MLNFSIFLRLFIDKLLYSCYIIVMNTFYYRHNKLNKYAYQIPSSKIDYNELTIVLKGTLNYEVDKKPWALNSGDAVFIRKDSIRAREQSNDVDYVSFNFNGNVDFFIPNRITDCVNSEINLLITVCDGIYSKYFNWQNKIDGVLKVIFSLIREKLHSREENPIVLKTKRYIRENISKKLNLNDIAKHIGYSPNYCDTLFKKYTNQPILDYVIENKISEAKLLLTQKILPLKEVAFSCGFEDYNYFSRLFKSKTGYTPSEYRNKIK